MTITELMDMGRSKLEATKLTFQSNIGFSPLSQHSAHLKIEDRRVSVPPGPVLP